MTLPTNFHATSFLPRVVDDYREERFDPVVMQQLGKLGLLGPTIPEKYGGAGVSHVAYGLAARELEAIDSDIGPPCRFSHHW